VTVLTELLREKHGKARESVGEGEYTYATAGVPGTSSGSQELEMSRVAELK